MVEEPLFLTCVRAVLHETFVQFYFARQLWLSTIPPRTSLLLAMLVQQQETCVPGHGTFTLFENCWEALCFTVGTPNVLGQVISRYCCAWFYLAVVGAALELVLCLAEQGHVESVASTTRKQSTQLHPF